MRIYNRWAGNPRGIKENPQDCVVEVMDGVLFHQCFRKRGSGKDGLFCKQHARMYPDGKSIYIPRDEV